MYWLPTVPSEYKDSDVPALRGLKLVANSEQNFGKWARRVGRCCLVLRTCQVMEADWQEFVPQLITMEKVADSDVDAVDEQHVENGEKASALPAHYDFRTSYFAKPER